MQARSSAKSGKSPLIAGSGSSSAWRRQRRPAEENFTVSPVKLVSDRRLVPPTLALHIAAHIDRPIMIAAVKTTLEISDPLLRDARKIAVREGTTLRALVEQGLRRIVAEKQRRPAFRLRKVTFRGRGLRPELAEAGWERIHDLIYGYPDK